MTLSILTVCEAIAALLALIAVTNLTFSVAVRRQIKRDIRDAVHMAADDFIARAIAQAQQAQQLAQGASPPGAPAGAGIFVVGSNITIMNNVHNSPVAAAEADET